MASESEIRRYQSATLQNLKLTRRKLSETLRAMKLEQEDLQTALKKIDRLSASACFRISEMQRHGSNSLAYSSLQEGLKYYMHEELGYLAYVCLGDSPDSVLVLADPICNDSKKEELIDAFLRLRSDPVFLHITKGTAEILSARGFSVNELGVETIVEIQKFELSGNKKQQLRAARNRAERDGIKVREVQQADDALIHEFRKVSDGWLKQKVAGDSQMKLVVRPMIYVDELDVRRFVAIKDHELIAFVVFDPIYENGKVKGYLANQCEAATKRVIRW